MNRRKFFGGLLATVIAMPIISKFVSRPAFSTEDINETLKTAAFDYNDDFTRKEITDKLQKQMQDLKNTRSIEDFRVVCDETNNTPKIIEQNELMVDIYVKPRKTLTIKKYNITFKKLNVHWKEFDLGPIV